MSSDEMQKAYEEVAAAAEDVWEWGPHEDPPEEMLSDYQRLGNALDRWRKAKDG